MKYSVQYLVFPATFQVISQKIDYLWDSAPRRYEEVIFSGEGDYFYSGKANFSAPPHCYFYLFFSHLIEAVNMSQLSLKIDNSTPQHCQKLNNLFFKNG